MSSPSDLRPPDTDRATPAAALDGRGHPRRWAVLAVMCLAVFVTVLDGTTVIRPELPDLGSGSPSLVRLDEDRLSDGPWCPDPSAPNRFDADLLRVRSVRVTLRVRSSRAFLRMPMPDRQIAFQVTPRNLSLSR